MVFVHYALHHYAKFQDNRFNSFGVTIWTEKLIKEIIQNVRVFEHYISSQCLQS